ncbi:hypothetical protein TNCV_4279221 [Trichonephila clavipes]|nr:hypothetical protein TNCV_4279221 [Trichonephila clavipes]
MGLGSYPALERRIRYRRNEGIFIIKLVVMVTNSRGWHVTGTNPDAIEDPSFRPRHLAEVQNDEVGHQ